MSIDLTKIRIFGKGPTTSDIRIETEDGQQIQGITGIQVTMMPNALIEVVLSLNGADFIDMEDLEASLKLDDQTLVKELRRRGYEVKIDDSDIQQELHQTDESD